MPASTVAEYLAALPADRRAAISAVREAINDNLPDGYEEGIQYGMISWHVPLSLYPAGYGENENVPLPFLTLGSQKTGMVLHFLSLTVIPRSHLVHERIQKERQETRHGQRLRPLQKAPGPRARRRHPYRGARLREGTHRQLPGGESVLGRGSTKKDAKKSGGEKGETKEVSVARNACPPRVTLNTIVATPCFGRIRFVICQREHGPGNPRGDGQNDA